MLTKDFRQFCHDHFLFAWEDADIAVEFSLCLDNKPCTDGVVYELKDLIRHALRWFEIDLETLQVILDHYGIAM